jgi:hypothetical protein
MKNSHTPNTLVLQHDILEIKDELLNLLGIENSQAFWMATTLSRTA